MLNLEELKQMLNVALANETTESWNSWYESQALAGLKEYVGNSIIDSFPFDGSNINITTNEFDSFISSSESSVPESQDNYKFAA